ncbi:MAG: tyrosine-type recombinase/integrase [Bacteroidetes bacterium]|nr:tyrosine-type recombinase/integrase [Bacteroidota bacterium]
MEPALTPSHPPTTVHQAIHSPDVSDATRRLIQASVSENTKAAYDKALTKLERWLAGRPLTDLLLAEYLTHCHEKGLAPATISMIPAAIGFAARLVGEEAPIGDITKQALDGIRANGQTRGAGQVNGITFTETKFLTAQIAKNGVRGIRDAALFSLMSDCMLRIGELVAVRPLDIHSVDDGSGRLHIPRSKTDREGKGATLYVGPPTMERIRDWTHLIEEQLGGVDERAPLFRAVRRGGHIQSGGISMGGVRWNLKTYVEATGLEGRFSGHSFRVGTAQSLARQGATLTQMQTVGRWKTSRMPAAYCRNELAGRSAVATLLYKKEATGG